MARLIAIALTLVVGCTLGGCGGGEESATTTASTQAGDDTLVTYKRGGGYAPVNESLQVTADGSATLDAGFQGGDQQHAEFSLSAEELSQLQQAVEAADLEGFTKGTAICADCYTYSLETAGGKIDFTDVDLDDGSDAKVPIEVFDLLDVVSKLVSQHTPGAAAAAPASR